MASNEFDCLLQKHICELLNGDIVLIEKDGKKYPMPYLSGPDLCSLSTRFGKNATYTWGSGAVNGSRWTYMQSLLKHTIASDQISVLLSHLFSFERFVYLKDIGSAEVIQRIHFEICTAAIDNINSQLLFSAKELKILGGRFVITKIGEKPIIEAPVIKNIDSHYVQGLRDRIEENIESGDFDSVITKSRTLIEEVLIYILEQRGEPVSTKGDISKLYQQVKVLLGMNQSGDFDKRVNGMLSGLEKIIQAIAEMRNSNSDAHGVGSKRIEIRKHEALLVVNSAITLSEYVLSVYNFKRN